MDSTLQNVEASCFSGHSYSMKMLLTNLCVSAVMYVCDRILAKLRLPVKRYVISEQQ